MNTKPFLPYQQRVVEEKDELGKKLSALTVFFKSETYFTLPFSEQLRMLRQLTAMQLYFDALQDRINGFSNPEDSAMARNASVLSIQLDEVMRDQTDSYMVGMYNGMLLICCNEDNVDYHPIQALKSALGQEQAVAKEFAFEQVLNGTTAADVASMCIVGEESGLTD